MIRWGSIKQQMLVVAVLPLLVFAFALGVYFIQSRVADTDQGLTARGQTIARLLAVSVEFGLLTGNRDMLGNQVLAQLNEDDVLEIVVLDQQFSELVRRSGSQFSINRHAVYPRLEGGYGYFLAPVTTSGITFQDLPEFSDSDNSKEIIGWVAVVMSQAATQQQQQQIIAKGVLLLLAGMVGSLLLVSRFSSNIIEPVEDLTRVVKDIEAGQLWRRADDEGYGEMQLLLRGFNRMAQTVEDSNTMLELRVNEQTRALRRSMADIKRNNNALSRARERADRANQAKDEFLARMSHELRTPLTSVIGFSRMLQQSGLNPEQQEFSRIINLTSGMLLSVIDDILDFSRLESRAITLEALPFYLQRCVEEVVEMLSPVAHEKRIELVLVVDPRLPERVRGDAARLRQVLVNLISNAIKFTDQGAVEVQVRSLEGKIRLEVRDTGIGIPDAQLETLFSAFVQADTSITRRYGGSGLGLAISRHLTELMGGQIDLVSREGDGTRIWLDIPFEVVQAPRMGPFCPVYNRVLVLVEHPSQRQGLGYQLLSVAAEVVYCRDMDELSQQLSQADWDLVLLYQTAGDVGNTGLLYGIRTVRQRYAGLLVVLSGAQLELPEEMAVRVLHKPLSIDTLIQMTGNSDVPRMEVADTALLSRQIRVLVAEDNNFNRLLIRRVLEEAGAEVLEVVTGVEAVACACEFSPDLVLMDVHMPEMDGIEATRQIRQAGFSNPILALTANVVEREHEVLHQAGVNEVLLKPIEDKVLIGHLNRYIAGLAEPEVQSDGLSGILDRYRISREAFSTELLGQIDGIGQALSPLDRTVIRHHTHQLVGLAGLYELPELDMVSHALNTAAKEADGREIWQQFWRLQRIIRQALSEL